MQTPLVTELETPIQEQLRRTINVQTLIASWGVLGVLLLLSQAIWRLGARALEALRMDLSSAQIALLLVWTAFNLYAEGYRAFQKRFSPRVVVRAAHLSKHPTLVHVALAPFYCMALFHATRRNRLVAWGTVIMVMAFILLLRQVPQPWRGMVDAGVVVALAWGAGAIIVFHVRALFTGKLPDCPTGLPEGEPPAP